MKKTNSQTDPKIARQISVANRSRAAFPKKGETHDETINWKGIQRSPRHDSKAASLPAKKKKNMLRNKP